MHQIVTRVVGVGNSNSDGTSRQSILKKAQPGADVMLNHVLSQEGDPNTIEVLLPGPAGKKPRRIGFLPGRVGEKLVHHLDAGRAVTAVIHDLVNEADPALRVIITY